MSDWRLLTATVGGVGTIRRAPGTWGSLAAAAIALVVAILVPGAWLGWTFLGLAVAAVVVGMVAIPAAQDRYGALDPGQVVIDEVAGVWLGLAVVPAAWIDARPLLSVLAVFALFRAIDIAKPWPVGLAERLPGAWGVMADDLVAGLAAGVAATPLVA